MAVKVFNEKTYNIAYSLDDESLRKLTSITKEVFQIISWDVMCTDNSIRHCSDIEEVLDTPNTDNKRIRLIRVNATSLDGASATIYFRNNQYTPINVQLYGEDKSILYFSN